MERDVGFRGGRKKEEGKGIEKGMGRRKREEGE